MARSHRERGEGPQLTRFCARLPNLPLAQFGEHRYTAKIARERPHCLDIRALAAMFRATFGKPSVSHAQHYCQNPYRRRTQAHRRGWLAAIHMTGGVHGPSSGPFLFPEPDTNEAADNSASGASQ